MRRSIGYMGIIIVILVFIVSTSGCTSINGLFSNKNASYTASDTSYNLIASTPTKTYSAYGVSFKYPSGWFATSDNTTGDNIISVMKGISFNGAQLTVQIVPNNGMPEQGAASQIGASVTPGWTKNASYMVTVNGQTAYEDVYKVNDSHYSKLMRFAVIYFSKNDKTYLLTLQAPDNEFDKNKPYFGVILNSFKVQ